MLTIGSRDHGFNGHPSKGFIVSRSAPPVILFRYQVLVPLAGFLVLVLGIGVFVIDRQRSRTPAVAALLAPTGSSASPDIGPSEPATPSLSPGSAGPSINGSCNAQGVNIVITCNLPEPKSRVKVTAAAAPIIGVWFDGTPDQLPTPPDYTMASAHCTEWDRWFRDTPQVYFDNPVIDFALETGVPDQIVIRKIEMEIYRRTLRTVGSGTWIQCNWGGGSNNFYVVDVDTAERSTTVQEFAEFGPDPDAEDRTYPMPPGTISLSGIGETTVRIGVNSLAQYKYEGAMVVTASVNGEETVYTIGSRDKPVRWISSAEGDGELTSSHYGWDVNRRRWVKDFQPF